MAPGSSRRHILDPVTEDGGVRGEVLHGGRPGGSYGHCGRRAPAYYVCSGPRETRLLDLARIAGTR